METPKFNFFYGNKHKNAKYICFLAKNITEEKYQNAGFYVLPEKFKNLRNRGNLVIFPDLNYSSEFWYLINKYPHDHIISRYPQQCILEVERHLGKSATGNSVEEDIIRNWKNIFRNVTNYLGNIFDLNNLYPKISKINVNITAYGTSGSFYCFLNKLNNKFEVNLMQRSDCDETEICRTFVLVLYRIEKKINHETNTPDWFIRQNIADFLVEHYRYLTNKKYCCTKNNKDYTTSHLIKESDSFLNKLGFPKCIDIKPAGINKFLINGISSQTIFSYSENRIFNLLWEKRGNVVSPNNIGDIIWGNNDDDKYSLYSITKHVENIRKKLRMVGLNKQVIVNFSGKGYLLRV